MMIPSKRRGQRIIARRKHLRGSSEHCSRALASLLHIELLLSASNYEEKFGRLRKVIE
jgi:hypothetical protein